MLLCETAISHSSSTGDSVAILSPKYRLFVKLWTRLCSWLFEFRKMALKLQYRGNSYPNIERREGEALPRGVLIEIWKWAIFFFEVSNDVQSRDVILFTLRALSGWSARDCADIRLEDSPIRYAANWFDFLLQIARREYWHTVGAYRGRRFDFEVKINLKLPLRLRNRHYEE